MTDVVGSTRLWENNREEMALCIARLDRICERTFEQAGGKLHRSRGEGDSYFAAFGSAEAALTAATNFLIAIKGEPSLHEIVLRIAIHAGSAEAWAGDYYGPAVNRCARIREACRPGQILVSEAVYVLGVPSGKFAFKDLGMHRLRDLMLPERLFQVLHPELPSEFASPNTLTALSHNLPSHPTSFVGRVEDIRALGEVVRSNRLTTVTGAGGAGKTRLTLQVAAECVEEFKEGAWFIDLAQSARTESVLPILCAVLEPGIEATEQSLLEAIRHRQMLLILDNCEHLFDECRKVADVLLRNCPNLRILATSRRVLEVRGEHVYKLGGLSLPGPDQVLDALQFDGIRLFVERAAKRGTGLAINDSTLPGIVELCAKLDGLPLSIEIVASQTDVLSVKEILRSIGECLETPIGHGSEDPRQHTISSAIEWSRQLLTPEAQKLLDHVAIFPNTWTLAAACEVCFAGADQAKARDTVKELFSHSLVFSTRTPRDDLRFGLLQTTREVVAKGSSLHHALALPYIAFCRKTVESAQAFMESGEEARAHELIGLEWETLMKGLAISFDAALYECVAMALALRSFWVSGARLPDGKAWYERLTESAGIEGATRASLQIALSGIYILLGENDDALRVLLAAEEAMRPIGGLDLARAIGNLAVHQDRTGRYVEAKEGFERCCALFKECGAPYLEAKSQLNLGVVKLRLGEPLSECAQLYREALNFAQAAGAASMQADAHSCLAHVELKEGRFAEALSSNKAALTLWQADPNIPECALTMLDLAEIFLNLTRFDACADAIHIAERLEVLSQSPFPSLHRTRLHAYIEAVKPRQSPTEWRAGQRLTRSKSANELITMAIQLLEEAEAS